MKIIKYITPVLVLSILISCGANEINLPNEKVTEQKSNTIVVTAAQFELGKMKLGNFSNQVFHRVVKANGILDVPPENKASISSYFGGYVKNMSLLQGQKVVKGQTLFTLENPDYIQLQQDFLEAKSLLSYLKLDYERQKELAASNVSSQKIFLKAASDYKITLVKFEAIKKKLALMNINSATVTAQNLRSTIAVKSPISGYITSVLTNKGMVLNPSDIALTIINTDHMHIELNIFEQNLTKVAIGEEVSFSIQNDTTQYKGEVHLINKAIDPIKRTIRVHCHFKNEREALSLTPGMFVDAEIYVSSDSAYALPFNSVVSVENKSYVLKQKEKLEEKINFEKVEVKIGQSNSGYIEILNAQEFKEKTLFLTCGAFNLIQE